MANDKILVWVLIVIAVLLIHSMGIIKIPGLQAAGGAGEDKLTEDDSSSGTLCLHDGSVMTVGPAQRRYAPTTAVTSATATMYHRVIIDGVDRGLKSDGTTIDVVTPTRVGGTDGSSIEIYYAENNSNYYAAKQAFTVPCASSFSSGARPDSDAYKVVANSTPTISVFCADDGLLNTDANNESMSADDSADLDVKLDWPAKKGFSPYGEVYFTVEFNDSAYDQQNFDLTSNDVAYVNDCNTPQFRSSENLTAKYAMKTWCFPGNEGLTTRVQRFNLHIDSSTLDPVATSGAGTISVYIDDEDWFRNSETGKMEIGPETDANADVGYTAKDGAYGTHGQGIVIS